MGIIRIYSVIILTAVVLLVSCSIDEEVVNVYSGRHYKADEDLFNEFTAKTGIRVNLIKADSDQLINRMLIEGSNTRADLFITADVGRLTKAVYDGILMAVDDVAILHRVPANLRHPEGYWIGLTKRARVVAYHLGRVDASELSTYEELASDRWKGRVLVRSSQSHYNQSLVASLIAANGIEKTTEWAAALTGNMAQTPRGNDRDQIKALAAGAGDIAIVNTYYLGLLLRSQNEEERLVAQQVGLFFPNRHGRGAHVNVSGMGITAHAKNRENALKLMAFLLSDEAQQRFAEENFEYPVVEHVELPDLLKSWGAFREDTVNIATLGQYLPDAMLIFNKVGWQ
jgi:iron(III) transport system substrate-binding protein